MNKVLIHILYLDLFIFAECISSTTILCKQANYPVNLQVGGTLNFQCETNDSFHSCIIERKSRNEHPSHCRFKFNSPPKFHYSSETVMKLQKARWDCELDSKTPHRFHVLENTNERKCHLKIEPVNLNGNKILIFSILQFHT